MQLSGPSRGGCPPATSKVTPPSPHTYCGHSRYCRMRASWTHACPFLPTPLNSPSTLLERLRQASRPKCWVAEMANPEDRNSMPTTPSGKEAWQSDSHQFFFFSTSFWRLVSWCSPGSPPCSVDQAVPELSETRLPLPPGYWDQRRVPPVLSSNCIPISTTTLVFVYKHRKEMLHKPTTREVLSVMCFRVEHGQKQVHSLAPRERQGSSAAAFESSSQAAGQGTRSRTEPQPPCWSSPLPKDSLGILALLIEHHNLIHTEDGAGSGDLASQVGAEFR